MLIPIVPYLGGLYNISVKVFPLALIAESKIKDVNEDHKLCPALIFSSFEYIAIMLFCGFICFILSVLIDYILMNRILK